jgi:hypothetical protein
MPLPESVARELAAGDAVEPAVPLSEAYRVPANGARKEKAMLEAVPR